jgi:hypothetical protein
MDSCDFFGDIILRVENTCMRDVYGRERDEREYKVWEFIFHEILRMIILISCPRTSTLPIQTVAHSELMLIVRK